MCATNLDRRDTTPAPPFLNALNTRERLATNGRLAATQVHLRLQRSLLTVLAN
jgi:hypothetical protein